MTQTGVYDRLTAIFREVFDDDSIVITPETTADDIAGWDSVNHIRLIVSIESAFAIRFTVDEIAEAANVGEFAALIERKQ